MHTAFGTDGLRGTDRLGSGLREMVEGARELLENRPGQTRRPRGDVRAAILALLAEEPMHGYQLISEIEKRSGGSCARARFGVPDPPAAGRRGPGPGRGRREKKTTR